MSPSDMQASAQAVQISTQLKHASIAWLISVACAGLTGCDRNMARTADIHLSNRVDSGGNEPWATWFPRSHRRGPEPSEKTQPKVPRCTGKPMSKLVTVSQFSNPDLAYVTLVDARRGLSREAAAELDTKLVLLLANHIGDLDVLTEAIEIAKRNRSSAATLS